ncbi:FAD:protein FMN transferase [Roseiconus lacunae]|uniref:FAD:protein FMN transferase n=1 Tax=Roseiconus lacunae TaxID=2605694 RepID=UPI001E3F485F|nr:FAD:protein FMN transferase [Roseiconus lacunae]MCD0460759.1 FAD:protein FMN transferase [Roseiconus lacunae]
MLTTLTHRAMACEFVVMLPPSDAPRIDAAFTALECLDEIEATLSVYKPDSEISRINRNASDRWVNVSPATFRLLQRSLGWSDVTEGAFDITAGPLVRAWGFLDRQGKKPSADQVHSALSAVGYDAVRLREDDCAVRFDRPSMEINLGAIGKGFALDCLADSLSQAGLKNFLIHGGGSSVLARGDQFPLPPTGNLLPPRDKTSSTKPESKSEQAPQSHQLATERSERTGWAVGLAHPSKPRVRLAGLRLVDESLSTSGSGKQFFHHRGRRYGHVIDPRTGYPAGEMLSLTAIANSATDAEACSTAFFLSPIADLKRLAEQDQLPTKLIGTVAQSRQDAVEVIAFSEIDWLDRPDSNA